MSNVHGLAPIYYPNLVVGQEINHPFVISNPFTKALYVEEFYLTNTRFKAEFKKVNIGTSSAPKI